MQQVDDINPVTPAAAHDHIASVGGVTVIGVIGTCAAMLPIPLKGAGMKGEARCHPNSRIQMVQVPTPNIAMPSVSRPIPTKIQERILVKCQMAAPTIRVRLTQKIHHIRPAAKLLMLPRAVTVVLSESLRMVHCDHQAAASSEFQ